MVRMWISVQKEHLLFVRYLAFLPNGSIEERQHCGAYVYCANSTYLQAKFRLTVQNHCSHRRDRSSGLRLCRECSYSNRLFLQSLCMISDRVWILKGGLDSCPSGCFKTGSSVIWRMVG